MPKFARLTASTAACALSLLVVLVPSCRCAIDDTDLVATEQRVVESWLTSTGGSIEPQGGPIRTVLSRELTWKVGSAESWPDYRRALLTQPLAAYPPCREEELRVVCKRTLTGDVFVIEVEAAERGARQFVARFRATSY
jgi:hypothetical protein